jgi:hypothetical protein
MRTTLSSRFFGSRALRRTSSLQWAAALSLSCALTLASTEAHAADPAPAEVAAAPHPFAYGILIGTNEGGAGQQTLHFAEDDARKVADVLRDLGRFGNADLHVLTHPDTHAVFAAIDEVAAKLAMHRERGEQAILIFYYSGHAKANAFSLGNEELPISMLRDRLQALPTTLTLVVIDACQSGKFARIKGAEPAADFSFNTVSRLTTKGLAVMASSTAEELSQESDELHSSYFTHHLIVGLRGAADADGDGRVSLDEAYRYAYRRTLSSTSQTQVGAQHVTLQTELGGQGDVPVTYPAAARSHLLLGAALDGRVLLQLRPSGSVVAEVQKAPGSAVRLALTSGSYDAVLRGGGKILRCRLALADEQETQLEPAACTEVKDTGVAKGEDPSAEPAFRADPLSVEAGIGFIFPVEDSWTKRLNEFGYKNTDFIRGPTLRGSVGVFKGLFPHLSVGAELHTLAGDTYHRTDVANTDDTVSFDAYGVTGWVRGTTSPFWRFGTRGPYFQGYGQVGGGLVLGVQHLVTGEVNGAHDSSSDTYVGWEIGAVAGLVVQTPHLFGFYAQGGYEYAPAIANLLGDKHDSGGPSIQTGVRLNF